MAKPCSLDVRMRVIDEIEAGASRREAAEWLNVSPSSAVKWMQRWETTGSIVPKPSGGSVSPLEQHAAWFLALNEAAPDLTLDEIVIRMRKARIAGSRTAVHRFFERHQITVKKSLHAAEQEWPDVARSRQQFKRRQRKLDPRRLVFLDETATNTKMVRTRGRCRRGKRLLVPVPHGHWKTLTLVAALRCNRMVAPMTTDGGMTGEMFRAYVEQVLAPKLKPKDIVMMDNLGAHNAPGVKKAIEARGATLQYLPKYSPDLNPIEMSFSKLKAFLRQQAKRTVPELCRAMGSFVPTVTAAECRNFFSHAGYVST